MELSQVIDAANRTTPLMVGGLPLRKVHTSDMQNAEEFTVFCRPPSPKAMARQGQISLEKINPESIQGFGVSN